MTDNAFVDTKILVYARDPTHADKHRIASQLINTLWANRQGRISAQVLNEYLVTVTQKLRPGMTFQEAWEDVQALMAWEPLSMDGSLLELGRIVHLEHGVSWWDSLILAAAHKANCTLLYSEDLAAGRVYGGVGVVNPFLSH